MSFCYLLKLVKNQKKDWYLLNPGIIHTYFWASVKVLFPAFLKRIIPQGAIATQKNYILVTNRKIKENPLVGGYTA
jgi:hypothetical protein